MPVYAPQFNASSATAQRKGLELKRQQESRKTTDELRATLDRSLDHARFDAAFSIGKPLDHDIAKRIHDDFFVLEAAEKCETAPGKLQLHAFILARSMLKKRMDSGAPITLSDAKAVHHAADMGRLRIKRYSIPALVQACIAMNNIYIKRGDAIAFKPTAEQAARMHQA